jgi:hypothetical protein
VLEASTAAGDAYAGYASPEFIVGTGRIDANTLIPGSGWLNYAIYHNKALSAVEAKSRYDNKFSIFGVPARRLFPAASRNNLAATSRMQPNAAGIAAVTQGHALAAIESAQANTGDTATIVQVQRLAPTASVQAQAVSAGAVTQHNILTGTVSAQANLGAAMPAFQDHSLLPAPAMQANTGETGEAALTMPASLSAVGSMQGNAASTTGIGRGLALSASRAGQGNIALAAAIIQKHLLAVPSWSIQGNASSVGSMLSTHYLIAANPAQANICGAAAIGGTLLLAVAASRQFNFAIAATMGGATIEPALARARIKRTSIKKPGIPAGTPEWLKTMIEILTGRRGNQIEAPKFQRLTFSETPTQAECEALYSYTNAVRAAVEQVISRMDG